MSTNKVRDGKLLYHLTKLKNLESILKNGLLSRNDISTQKLNFDDVADANIIEERSVHNLGRYVPFHFHPYSAFDYAVKYASQDEFIYICVHRDFASENNFSILPMHPLSTEKEINMYDYKEGFEEIDWNSMVKEGNEDPRVKQVKMAECLSLETILAKNFFCIYVRNDDVKENVAKLLGKYGFKSINVYIAKWLSINK